jgi:hypothetical protein
MNTNSQTTTEAVSNVGEIMKEGTHRALRKIVIGGGILVYVASVVYAEVHGFSILSAGVKEDFVIWATVGMVALGITALALPLALHVWAFEHLHRLATCAFYAVDVVILGINSLVDFNVNTGQQLATWAQIYLDYILPATPVIAGIGWCILLLLDPASKAMILRHTLRESIREAKAQQIMQAANSDNVSEAVREAARAEVDSVLTELFGRKVITMRQHEAPTTTPQVEEGARTANDNPFPSAS